MKRPTLLTVALLAALALPWTTLAEPPASVTQLSAQFQTDGSIKVSWAAVTGDVQAYRVYYSQKSILENNGYYDDVEMVVGTTTSATLRSVPSSFPEVFIGIMAVNGTGEESGFFIEEVRVKRPASSLPASKPSTPLSDSSASLSSLPSQILQTSSLSSVSSSPSVSASTLRLLSAEPLSATRVGLAFSTTPIIEASQAPQAFSIIDPSGNSLPIEQLTIDGKSAIVQTARQGAGMVYQIRLSEPLMGEGSLPLDPLDRTSFFMGHSTGLTAVEAQNQVQQNQPEPVPTPAPAPPSVQQTFSLPDVMNFTLKASPQPNQLFTMIGQWGYDPDTPEDAFLVVRQSRDGGRTFGKTEYLPRTVDGVRIPDVKPENFGIVVYVVDAAGGSSQGVFKSVFAWNTPVVVPKTAASVLPKVQAPPPSSQKTATLSPETPKAKRLTQTGAAGTLSALVLVGGAFGWKRARRSKKTVTA